MVFWADKQQVQQMSAEGQQVSRIETVCNISWLCYIKDSSYYLAQLMDDDW